jgi:hypothetical protein
VSLTVTVKSKAVPAVAEAGAVKLKLAATLGFTAMLPLVPVTEEVTVSVAVTVWVPAVSRVTPAVKVCLPLSPD